MEKIIVEIGRTIGKAVLAGVGVELARLASLAVRKKLTPKQEAEKAAEKAAAAAEEEQDLKAENEKLKAELAQLKSELAARSSSGV